MKTMTESDPTGVVAAVASLAALQAEVASNREQHRQLAHELQTRRRAVRMSLAALEHERSRVAAQAARPEDEGNPPRAPKKDRTGMLEEDHARMLAEYEQFLRQSDVRRSEIQKTSAQLSQRCAELVGALPPELAQAYERLSHRGVWDSVATADQGRCGACGAELDADDAEKVGTCQSCGRLWLATEPAASA